MTVKKSTTAKKAVNQKDIEENKTITILSYLGILFVIPMLLKPKSEFVKFHVKQGLVLTIGWFIGMVLYPVMGLGFLVHVAIVVLSIMGIMNVSEGNTKKLPVVGDLADKFNF